MEEKRWRKEEKEKGSTLAWRIRARIQNMRKSKETRANGLHTVKKKVLFLEAKRGGSK
jgi:ABC-type hemin transport system substrate-binding protein